MADSEALGMVDPSIFKSLQNTIDKDYSVRERFKDILQSLDKQGMNAWWVPAVHFDLSLAVVDDLQEELHWLSYLVPIRSLRLAVCVSTFDQDSKEFRKY